MFEKAIELLKGCKSFLIIFDTDGDGIGSAVIFAKAIERAIGVKPKAMHKETGLSFISKKTLESINGKFDAIIILDITASERPELVSEMSKYSKMLLIDHHQTKTNLNSQNIVQINPDIIGSDTPSHRYCTSKLSFDICSRLAKIDDLDWVAATGIINDKAEDSWKEFMKSVYENHEISFDELETTNNIITSSYQFSKKPSNLAGYRACLEATGPFDILKARTEGAKKLWKFYNIIEKEIREAVKTWKSKAEIFKDKKLIILEVKSRFSISSAVSTILSFSMPHQTVIVGRKSGSAMSISLRRQDKKVNCGELAKKLAKSFRNASGGGHVPAAGLKIMSMDWEKLKKSLLEEL